MENIGEIRGPIAEGKRDYGLFTWVFPPVAGTENRQPAWPPVINVIPLTGEESEVGK